MRIYLDNNATTAIHPQVLRVLEEAMRETYGNASSIHREGQAARRVIENARESVARLIVRLVRREAPEVLEREDIELDTLVVSAVQ